MTQILDYTSNYLWLAPLKYGCKYFNDIKIIIQN